MGFCWEVSISALAIAIPAKIHTKRRRKKKEDRVTQLLDSNHTKQKTAHNYYLHMKKKNILKQLYNSEP